MSQLLIQQYLNQLATLRMVSGSHRESVVREAFKDLLKNWGRLHDLHFVPEYEIETKTKERRYIDGALLYELRMPFGYWEAKDEKDDLDAEIALKFKRGYPQDNIIFEDTREAVLIQDRQEVMRCGVREVVQLEKLIGLFFGFERKEIGAFRRAVEQFKLDLPDVLKALRQMIEKAHVENAAFRKASARFLKHAQETINPAVTDADVSEMLIQHVLTEDVFSKVFGEDDFHHQNNIAKELYSLEGTFFTGDLKKRTLRGLDPYYTAIRSAAAQIGSHTEKQTFLKVIYENFYKVYNLKAADRLGVVYTPNEIVRFMIESADWLCEKHFGRNLIDKDVDILDPAVGTGTFISELIEHFRGQPTKLKRKYLSELHANEVAILPYYVANLNIEATYAAITGEYLEYPNLCFVDTLDNVGGLRKHVGHIDDLFGSVSEQNVARIRRQNSRRISVIVGNPPYNANQLNENDNNKNREYPEIDERIKETYIDASTAQKTKLYDMYARFFRWASDRLDANGILAFISNRSFIDSRTFDGFRKVVAREFNEIRIVDLGGDVRANPKLSGTTHNVFGIQTGVAISFMIRRAANKGCRIFYARRPEMETAADKLAFIGNARLEDIPFEDAKPDKRGNWINFGSSEFESFLPMVEAGSNGSDSRIVKSIFRLHTLGISTNRDEWVYDLEPQVLAAKINVLLNNIATHVRGEFGANVKWSETLKRRAERGQSEIFDHGRITPCAFRPFFRQFLYRSDLLLDRPALANTMFPIVPKKENRCIAFHCVSSTNPLCCLASGVVPDLNMLKRGNGGTFYVAEKLFLSSGEPSDNVTDWALTQFQKQYEKRIKECKRAIGKEAIFHYVYAVLHDPFYREKYAQNLKRDLPRIPFYLNFWQWSAWGKELMAMHIGYESIVPASLIRHDTVDEKARVAGVVPKVVLKDVKEAGRIVLDSETMLEGVPREAWNYSLGNRSALGWILDQYTESKPRDLTVREKFNTYRFADYKEAVVEMIGRVTTVSVETVKIVEAMKVVERK